MNPLGLYFLHDLSRELFLLLSLLLLGERDPLELDGELLGLLLLQDLLPLLGLRQLLRDRLLVIDASGRGGWRQAGLGLNILHMNSN